MQILCCNIGFVISIHSFIRSKTSIMLVLFSNLSEQIFLYAPYTDAVLATLSALSNNDANKK